MYIWAEGSGIPGSYYMKERIRSGSEQNQGNQRMAKTQEHI